ncbi:MAG: low molecular weight phosphatase family protein [Methylococcaceae bacterium]|nr:low molecular weight phosphatase family protein [Methylococcaceae bacterium]
MKPTVLFLCTGNYYRSRFAELLFNHLAPGYELEWRAFSRGIAIELGANNVGPISDSTVQALTERGVPVSEEIRYPLALKEEDWVQAYHVVALKKDEHLPMLMQKFPQWLECVEFWQVHDIDCAMPDEALPLIEEEVHGLLRRLAQTPRCYGPLYMRSAE